MYERKLLFPCLIFFILFLFSRLLTFMTVYEASCQTVANTIVSELKIRRDRNNFEIIIQLLMKTCCNPSFKLSRHEGSNKGSQNYISVQEYRKLSLHYPCNSFSLEHRVYTVLLSRSLVKPHSHCPDLIWQPRYWYVLVSSTPNKKG